jgi:signal transduction histidine kinase
MIGTMTVTLIGLIVVQAYWIKNGIRLKKEQFKNLAQSALNEVVEKLKTEETLFHISNEITGMNPDSVVWREEQLLTKSQLRNGHAGFNISFSQPLDMPQLPVENETLADSGVQITDPNEQIEQAESKIKEKLNHIDNPTQQQLFIKHVMERMIRVNTRIEEQISQDVIRNLIRKALNTNGINFEFEFAVSNPMEGLVYRTPEFNPQSGDPIYYTQLRPANYMTEGNFLSIQFVNERDSLSNVLNMMTLISVILTLIIIVIFAVTIYVILRQKKNSEIRADFVNNMTHEFKTPIATISLASEMLRDPGVPIELKTDGYIPRIIEDETKRLLEQVEKILQTAMYERKKMELKPKELDFNDLVQGVVRNFQIHVEKKNGKIECELEKSLPLIFADSLHLTNLVNNLLDNALKYTHAIPEIKVSTSLKRTAIELKISDNGIGMSSDDQKRVFDQFYRVSTGNKHDVKGFGLGLSYVKKVVDAHGGVIKVSSELNKGTSFKILFPKKNE